MPCARTVSTPSSTCAARSADESSAPIARPPVVSVESACDRCSQPIIGRHGRRSSPALVRGVDADGHRRLAVGQRRRRHRLGPRALDVRRRTAPRPRTGARRPASPVVSAYGGCGTASTSPPPWSTGASTARRRRRRRPDSRRPRRRRPSRASPGRGRRRRDSPLGGASSRQLAARGVAAARPIRCLPVGSCVAPVDVIGPPTVRRRASRTAPSPSAA